MFRPLLATSILVAALVLPAGASAFGPQSYTGPSLHPSGNERLVDNGGSGTQGNAVADPDDMYNLGVDQFGGTGGLYLVDQDGNNGCGNDHDFEDDNNGNCGRLVPVTGCPTGFATETVTTLPATSQGRSTQHVTLTCVPEDDCDMTDPAWSLDPDCVYQGELIEESEESDDSSDTSLADFFF